MANTPNMGIQKPVPLSDSNLAGANEVGAALDVIDAHNHTAGRGLQIPTLGLNINADLTFNGFQAIGLKAVQLNQQVSTLGSSLKGYLYFAPGSGGVPFDLWANDGNGTAVQITKAGNVNVSAAGAISGLSAPASAAYGAGTFTWQSNTNVPAKMDSGDIVVRKAGATSPNGITITTVNSLASAYTLTLPATLPGSNLPLSVDATGQVSAAQIATAQIANGAVGSTQIASGGVATANIASQAVTTATIADANVTRAKLVALGQVTTATSSTATVTNTSYVGVPNMGSVAITTTGRPLAVMLVPDTVGGATFIQASVGINATVAGITLGLSLDNGSTISSGTEVSLTTRVDDHTTGTLLISCPPGAYFVVLPLAASTYTLKLMAKVANGFVTGVIQGCKLFAWEL